VLRYIAAVSVLLHYAGIIFELTYALPPHLGYVENKVRGEKGLTFPKLHGRNF
jgi:hypothetical protein